MKNLVFALLCLAPTLLGPRMAWAQKYSLRDAGEFQPMGHGVEFYDRFGWMSYQVDFDFGLDSAGSTLTKGSRLTLRIVKRDGSTWDYDCKAGGRRPLNANINFVYGRGISVVVDCRIEEKYFAQAVELHPDDVGAPSLVFQAMIKDGQVTPGAQRGITLLPATQVAASELSPYLSTDDDPTGLAVVFQSVAALP